MATILVLGGTGEASALARALAARGDDATLSYAGRIAAPRAQPIAVRIGGFGGAYGLAAYLIDRRITHLVDATHPFAARISANSILASARAGIPIIALTRPEWQAAPGDRWTRVADIDAAVASLDGPATSVMLALGRMHVDAFAARPQHRYLLRFVDPPDRPPALPRHRLVIDRGPYHVEDEVRLLRTHGIERIVCKNAGGTGADAKLTAARMLGLPVTMIDRPACPARHEVETVAAVLDWIDHGVHRGV